MQYNQLITEFYQDIVGLIREEALNALTSSYTSPIARPRRIRPRKAVEKTSPATLVFEQYMPNVSPEILSDVHGVLLPYVGATSHRIAEMVNRGETTVRVALKHLFSQGKCRIEFVGRSIHYFQAFP
jgi:hypothetical protein